jgi:hypothetical protein
LEQPDLSSPKKTKLLIVQSRNPMKNSQLPKHSLEILEARIAPASVPLTATWVLATHDVTGGPIKLFAGQGLSTGGPNSGDYLMYVEKGNAWVFTTDLNNNGVVDFNEITGIAAGDGLRLISFVDIHGDIVTNLREVSTSSGLQQSLSDSNNNPSDDHPRIGGDGRVVLNNRIEKIELRTLTTSDIPDQNQDGVVNDIDVDLRRVPSTHSIFGSIFAGRGFGVPEDPTSGLIIDSSVITNFGFEGESKPSIGSIRVGTAVSGEYFRFNIYGGFESNAGTFTQRIRAGIVLGDDTQGYVLPFVPAANQAGASISWVRSLGDDQFWNLNGLYAGNGGAGAVGGSILNVTINGDDAGGYNVVAGNGGSGTRGGAGGSILGFSDLNSDTSKVVIRSGDGGNGSTSTGGNAGNVEVVNANFYGGYSFLMGDGGDGFTQGGNGASLAKAIINQPVPNGVAAGTGWGTSHSPSYLNADPSQPNEFLARIGTREAFDFDGDGYGDYVYSTLDTGQLVVMFGQDPLGPGDGTFRTIVSPEGIVERDRIYLASPRNAESVVVADLNGDGRPDIAAASADVSNQAGVSVFISKYANDGTFLGFYDPRLSPLPNLGTGDPSAMPTLFGSWDSPHQVSEMVAGDFDGDGANELAVLVTYYGLQGSQNGVTISLSLPSAVVVFLSPDRELDTNTGEYFLTGNFYADFGTKRTENSGAVAPAEPRLPFLAVSPNPANVILDVTALSLDANHDTLLVGLQNSREILSVDYFVRIGLFPPPPDVIGSWDLGQVDTNRNPRAGNNANTNPAFVTLRDFTVVDFDGLNGVDGVADIIAISQNPNNFVVGVEGDGDGNGLQISDAGDPAVGLDQAGYYLGDVVDVRGVKAADGDGDGQVDDFVLLVENPPVNAFFVGLYNFRAGAQGGATGPQALGSLLLVINESVSEYRTVNIRDGVFWDLHYPDVTDLGAPNVVVAPQDSGVFYTGLFTIAPMAEPKLQMFAGDGGDSFVGRGGTGGFLGGKGSIVTEVIDPVTGATQTDYAGAIRIEFDGAIRLEAGDGGLGFSRGGNGGGITGVSVRDSASSDTIPSAALVAGNGGRGISGVGGQGGDLLANSIFNGYLFFAGTGGDGKTGGRGGIVAGNGLAIGNVRVYDTSTSFLEVYSGAGGNGIRGGGAGGNIVNFRPIIEGISAQFGVGGAMSYVAGRGGNAVAGVGGVGGSILDSSPAPNAILEDMIYVEAGRGGNGTIGGAGGSINSFSVTQESSFQTRIVAYLAGHGGNGTTGAGGKGGSVSNVSSISVGDAVFFPPLFPTGAYPNDPFPSIYTYSRILAGNGGTSFGGKGGDGGAVSSIVTGVTGGTLAIVSGAGGSGLSQGGAGGNVTGIRMEGMSGTAGTKTLVVAGAGGDARAFIPNALDTTPDQAKKAFGGRIGQGGLGGSINGFTQLGGVGAKFDFIAGDGGSTVHYGTVGDKKPFVGRGGSVLNINISGTVGNMEAVAAIKSYNDVLGGETMKDFVERRIRIGETEYESLSDADGNVGIVVGAAGRNKAVALDPLGAPFEYISQPATGARNGDLINLNTAALMSAVAGSVDRLSAIQLASNIRVSGGDRVGADKGVADVPEYINERGEIVNAPVRDGRLLDGAVIAKTLVSNPPLVGRIFSF